jgi:quercetin dioxygenase-like cupin family protein
MTTTQFAPILQHKERVLLPPAAGRSLQFGPDEYIVWKVTGATTGGLFDFCELTAQPEAGPPQHLHEQHDETFYILDGTFRMKVGNHLQVATAGAFVFIPRGTVHAWQNVGLTPGRLLILFTPGGADGYFTELAPLIQGSINLDQLEPILQKYHVQVVGPPLGGLQ